MLNLMMEDFSPDDLASELKSDASILGLPECSTELITKRVLEGVSAWIGTREIVTKSDLRRAVSHELGKYSGDLQLLYEVGDKII